MVHAACVHSFHASGPEWSDLVRASGSWPPTLSLVAVIDVVCPTETSTLKLICSPIALDEKQ
jgi:hypothetical protein